MKRTGGSTREQRASRASASTAATEASATLLLLHYQGRDPTPGAAVLRHRYAEVRWIRDEAPVIVCNEDAGTRIGERAREQTGQTVSGLRVSELGEESSELIGVPYLSRANGDGRHLGR